MKKTKGECNGENEKDEHDQKNYHQEKVTFFGVPIMPEELKDSSGIEE